MSFLPGLIEKRAGLESKANLSFSQPENEPLAELPLPKEDEIDAATGLAKRHADTKLQTRLSPEVLQRKLFDLYNERSDAD